MSSAERVREAREALVIASFFDAGLGMVVVPAPRLDAYAAAVRAEERARLVAENVKVANGLKAIRELARQVAEFYPEASERIKEAGICIVDEAEHLAALIGADK